MKTSVLNLLFTFLLLANLTSCQNKENRALVQSIKQDMQRVARWQINNFTYQTEGNLHDYGIDAWTNWVLYLGMLQWANIADEPDVYFDWLMNIGTENSWSIPANFADYPRYSYFHADELCIGQFYLGMYDKYKKDEMLASVQERADWIIANPPDTTMNYRNKQLWTWCDALFMASPVYAHLSVLSGSDKYLTFMNEHFIRSYNHLYDPENRLFFRDDSYFDKRENNGEKIFWGRGNGWVLAGLANIMKLLPSGSDIKPFYEGLFIDMAFRLGRLQDENGFWHASLLDPDSYPSPETSATALITYGLAYGINNGLLDKKEYHPIVMKGWTALGSAIGEDGKLGWVQPIGADPKKVTRDMTAVYGIGAYLMAGTEILKMIQ